MVNYIYIVANGDLFCSIFSTKCEYNHERSLKCHDISYYSYSPAVPLPITRSISGTISETTYSAPWVGTRDKLLSINQMTCTLKVGHPWANSNPSLQWHDVDIIKLINSMAHMKGSMSHENRQTTLAIDAKHQINSCTSIMSNHREKLISRDGTFRRFKWSCLSAIDI